mmetsp:Transcript_22478/g.46722  ORF Transcript_22478/g.46722 Transcript_22478/m.46722 type:complete len:221 (-) Transcript_22478:41-703(-)
MLPHFCPGKHISLHPSPIPTYPSSSFPSFVFPAALQSSSTTVLTLFSVLPPFTMTILSFPVPLYFFAPTTETPPILTKSTVLLSEFGTRGAGRAKPFVGRWYGGTGVAVWGEVLSGGRNHGGGRGTGISFSPWYLFCSSSISLLSYIPCVSVLSPLTVLKPTLDIAVWTGAFITRIRYEATRKGATEWEQSKMAMWEKGWVVRNLEDRVMNQVTVSLEGI